MGWVINQQLEDQVYPIVFGSLTFNPIESRYSQLKLELYGVLQAFKAERHWLHSIHFKLQVDTSSIIQMVNVSESNWCVSTVRHRQWLMRQKSVSRLLLIQG